MKKITLILAIAISLVITSCNETVYKKGDKAPEVTQAQTDSLSYMLGKFFGKNITMSNFGEINLTEVQKGFNDALNGRDTMIKDAQASQWLNNYLRNRMDYLSNKAKQDEADFLAKNKEEEGVIETESGLQYKILEEGTGACPELQDTVEVVYTGTLLNGEEFDSSKKYDKTVTFPLNRVIPGWSEGLQKAKEGSKMMIYVPAKLGYGARQAGPIPANSTLIFEVELVKIMKFAEPKKDTKSKK